MIFIDRIQYRKQLRQAFVEKVCQVFDYMVEQGYEDRQEQLCIAINIAEAVFNNETILIDAGVGTGKTFAYLVPCIFKNQDSFKPIIISTNTIILQDQLINKDIPILSKLMDIELDYIAAKGKENYLCLERAKYYEEINGNKIIKAGIFDRSDYKEINDITWEQICVSDDCQNDKCNNSHSCGFIQYRQNFLNVENILVCNHNLFFADLVRRINGKKPILPDYCSLVFDEAHTLELIAQKSFGKQLNFKKAFHILNLCKDFDVNFNLLKSAIYALNKIKKSIIVNFDPEANRFGITPNEDTLKYCKNLLNYINKITNALEIESEFEYGERRKIKRITDSLEEIYFVINCIGNPGDNIIWAETSQNYNGKQLSIWTTPKNINEKLNQYLFSRKIPIILSSATLASNGSFNYIANTLGINNYKSRSVSSPFDYHKNCLVYIANDLPEFTNNDQELYNSRYYEKIAERIQQINIITNGRSLILFTSHESLNKIDGLLNKNNHYKILNQFSASKEFLIETFKTDIESILLGTGFWEGVDVPGEALSCVIITKLPFPPLDPLLKNKIDIAESQGKDPFNEVTLPEMLLKLKQGAGRLIRNNEDYGVVAILDNRLNNKSYKDKVLEIFKGITITHELNDIEQFLLSHKR